MNRFDLSDAWARAIQDHNINDAPSAPRPERLPWSYYLAGLLILAFVTALPLAYRHIWLILIDITTTIHAALVLPPPPLACRRHGRSVPQNLSVVEDPDLHAESLDQPADSLDQSAKPFDNPSPSTEPSEDQDVDVEIARASAELASQSNPPDETITRGRICGLYVHPIKACRPVQVDEATITASGLAYDRTFAFAQPPTTGSEWTFVNQIKFARLQLVETEMWLPAVKPVATAASWRNVWINNGGCLLVRFPCPKPTWKTYQGLLNALRYVFYKIRTCNLAAVPKIEFRVPLCPSSHRVSLIGYQVQIMSVYGLTFETHRVDLDIDNGPVVLRQLATFLGASRPISLMCLQPGRETYLYRNAPASTTVGYQPKSAFQDCYPVSVQNLNSIKAIEKDILDPNKTLHDPSYKPDSRRFRSNIYVSQVSPFIEVNLKRFAVQPQQQSDPIVFAMPARTPRCTQPTTDPATAERSRTMSPLKQLRETQIIDEGSNAPVMGMHLVPFVSALKKVLRVGDACVFYQPGDHKWAKSNNIEDHTPCE